MCKIISIFFAVSMKNFKFNPFLYGLKSLKEFLRALFIFAVLLQYYIIMKIKIYYIIPCIFMD